MNRYLHAACAGAALIGLAVADSYGLLDHDTATMMYCLLPAFVFMSFAGRDQCRLQRREA